MQNNPTRISASMITALCVSLLALSACGGGGNNTPPIPGQNGQHQSAHGVSVPDASASSAPAKIYATTFNNSIGVYDEQGTQLTTYPFSGVNGPWQIAYDSHNGKLYVSNITGEPAIAVYDLNGNRATTAGSFSGALRTIAFDSHNDRLYTLAASAQTTGNRVAVFDENGTSAAITGTFPNATSPYAMAFDPFNHDLYVVNQTTTPEVAVYDEEGRQLPFSPSFHDCGLNQGISFDPHTRHFYMISGAVNCKLPTVTVFDETLKQVATAGSFTTLASFAETFDAHNNELYVEDENGFAGDIFDPQGNWLGNFPSPPGNWLLAAP